MLSKKYRLSKKERLIKPKLYNYIYFKVLKSDFDLPYPKFAVVISKKVARKAVDRNRIKRQIYSLLEELIKNNDFKIQAVVIIVKAEILNAKREEVEKELRKIIV